MASESDKKLVEDRLRAWIDSLPPSQKNLPFMHALGVSLTPEEMLQEVQGNSQLGEIIINDQLKLIKRYK